jgi:hypothetical protein
MSLVSEFLDDPQAERENRLRAEIAAWRDCADKLAYALENPDGSMFWHETELKALAHYERLKAATPHR